MVTVIDKLYQQLKSSPNNIEAYVHDQVAWRVSAPVNNLLGTNELLTSYWQPLVLSLIHI